jgi:hypothetical protein
MIRERVTIAALVLSTFVLALGYASLGLSEPISPSLAESANPYAASSLTRDERFVVTGDVVERVAAGMYSYVLVRDEFGELHWIVSLAATSPARASRVRALVVGRARNFESRLLSRRFDILLFGVVRDAEVN